MKPVSDLLFRNQRDETFEESSLTIKTLLSAHHIALWEYEIDSGEYILPDDYFRILGLERLEVESGDISGLSNLLHPVHKENYLTEFKRYLDERAGVFTMLVCCRGMHNETVWLENHYFRKSGKDGYGERLIVYTTDVTVRIEKEEKIRKLEEKNRKIIDVIPEFIFIFDENFFIRDILKANAIALLHPLDELIGGDGKNFYSPEVSDLFIKNIRACLEDGCLKEIEYHLDVDEVRYYYQARIVPFETNRVLALIHDIGDRVKRTGELIDAKRRAEDADRMKSLFLANMSHEIRTPLNAIVGFSEIIAVTDDASEKQEYMEIIRKNSNLLLQLVNDILDLSRIESGKSEIHPEPMSLSEWLEEVEKIHIGKTTAGVGFHVCHPQKDIWITTDRNRLSQIVFNLLSNAMKNTAQGSVSLGMNFKDDGWVEIYVQDTGCGISEEGLTRIFQRFEKLNDFAQGTGLGLPICQALAECLGGHISVMSEVSKGSTFTLSLPLN